MNSSLMSAEICHNSPCWLSVWLSKWHGLSALATSISWTLWTASYVSPHPAEIVCERLHRTQEVFLQENQSIFAFLPSLGVGESH